MLKRKRRQLLKQHKVLSPSLLSQGEVVSKCTCARVFSVFEKKAALHHHTKMTMEDMAED